MVKIGGFIQDVGGLGEDEKSVGETFRNPQQPDDVSQFRAFQIESRMATEIGRFRTKINRDIPDMSAQNTHKFSLRTTKLVVQSAENATLRMGLIILHKTGWKSCRRKGLLVINLGKPAAIISEALWLN